ncbi:hypothetical protein VH13_01060 [Corynebacterium ulcerans]|uniref:Suppressor of fused-like domain-containing protein n=1 Tax=Corynebacterium ramonii TaxID=3026968 RepID=A0ABM5RP32_9CORY|nr:MULTISPECIES: suppressor of fused domain protein [Corynebacterium]AIU31793.1 Hypothetical protein CulFRC11_0194 [Corynebacterium ramonii FRC0011]AKA95747.1 Hypothetical protein CUL131002_0193 [Corynebacterium ulcerans]ESU59314.1 hypothetical protein D881_01455 [Corynebacterium ulcerans NCTC 12077]KKO86369.1 hypothetical protein VH13_01060 [Corynebacterium ulcerans]KKO87013.1 hypothetical protein VH15_06485 [Corynebacterium ulcerans]
MILEETAVWIDGIIPGEMTIHLPETSYGEAFHIGTVDLGDQQVLATTLDFNGVDTGLTLGDGSDQVDVRSEIFTVGQFPTEVGVQVLRRLAVFLDNVGGSIPAQPGQLVPALGSMTDALDRCTVKHGLFVAPYVWGGQVPQYSEPSQLTALLQLIMLTQNEFDYATTYGIHELQQALGNEGVDLSDWTR